MQTVIYFVRHAETDYTDKDDFYRPLTEKGRADRIKVVQTLKDKDISVAYSSPYVRAYDTIKPLCNEIGLDICVVDDFRERKTSKDWLTGAEFSRLVRKQWEDFNFKLEGGESICEVQSRNIRALEEVLKECNGKSVVIGSHGMALSCVMNYFDRSFGYDGFEYMRPKMPCIEAFYFDGDSLGSFVKMEEIKIA